MIIPRKTGNFGQFETPILQITERTYDHKYEQKETLQTEYQIQKNLYFPFRASIQYPLIKINANNGQTNHLKKKKKEEENEEEI